MMKYVFFIIMIIILIIFLLVSLNNFSFGKGNINSKEKYSFLNQFPFELCDESKSSAPLFTKVLAALFGASFSIFGAYTFFSLNMYNAKIMQDYVMGALLLITGIVIFLLFVWDLKDYVKHLIVTSILFVITAINYIYFGLFVLMDPRELFHPALIYICFTIGILIVLCLLILPFKNWMYLEKDDKDGIIKYHRQKVSLLPLSEWIGILLNLIFAIIIVI